MYFAQCKNCLGVMNAILDEMKLHKTICGTLPATEIREPIDVSKDDHHEGDVNEQDTEMDGELCLKDEEEQELEDEENHELIEEAVVEELPETDSTQYCTEEIVSRIKPRAMKRPRVPFTTPTPSNTCRNCHKKTYRFEEAARVWTAKLEELPLEQALEIEKKMSDMLFEAMITNLQAKKAMAMGRGNIK